MENESSSFKTYIQGIRESYQQHNPPAVRKSKKVGEADDNPEMRLLDDAVDFGLKSMKELIDVKEPLWYKMGLVLDASHPAARVAHFGAPINDRAKELSKFGFAAVEATKKIAQSYPENVSRQSAGFPEKFQSRLLLDECPLRGRPRCPSASRRYRTADGTCNNPENPWRGSTMLPMQRFLPPTYEDGIQSVRRSVLGSQLPSARDISTRIHRDRNHEIQTVSLMFMQWGQFIDHDITSVVKSRSFNGSIPRCCERGGRDILPPELTHPSCLPIEVSDDDWFLSQFRIRCLEFIRSAPSTRVDCDLGWREQINQVTPFIDASTIYGSDIETSDSIRTFRNGKIFYGRPRGEQLQPPDPPGGELCRSGALTTDCFQAGDGRVGEQPGLTALHTVWVRYHNKIAGVLGKLNLHWSDEKIFQETRKIVYSLIQHITYREFLPIVLGQEVMELFELNLERKGFYNKYDARINPSVANAFSAAAFRFGHSMVQNSYVRSDSKHRPLFNNVSLHEDLDNFENIWSFGAIDRLILGFCNQPSQRRDEFVCNELTNHLFQSRGIPFGMDLAAINIQRGRDHGLPPYTAWRQPCGLSQINSWADLENLMKIESVQRFRSLYQHVDDIDLFSAGLAERPVRGGVVGPTFACIIAQQFLNLRKGDRFWYENEGFESGFTPAQLQQIRRVTLAQVLCETLGEIETIQPFVFLSHDNFRNVRTACDSPLINNFELTPWEEKQFEEPLNNKLDFQTGLEGRDGNSRKSRRKSSTSTTRSTTKKTKNKTSKPTLKIPITNITTSTVLLETKYGGNSIPQRPSFIYNRPQSSYSDSSVTYLVGMVPEKTSPVPPNNQKPIEVNIKIQYYPPTTTARPKRKKKRPTTRPTNTYLQSDTVIISTKRPTKRPETNYPIFVTQGYGNYDKPTTTRPYQTGYYDANNYYNSDEFSNRPYRPSNNDYSNTVVTKPVRPQNFYQIQYEDKPFSTSKRPYIYRPTSNYDRPQQDYYYDQTTNSYNYYRPSFSYNRDDQIQDVYSQVLNAEADDRFSTLPKIPTFGQTKPTKVYSTAYVEKLDDKLDFKTRFVFHKKATNSFDVHADDDGRFVKISSVKAGGVFTERNPDIYVVQSKEGDGMELYELGKEAKESKIRVVDLEVTPSEARKEQWVVYNATEELVPLLLVPDINFNVSCSNELPQPMNLTSRNSSASG